MTLSFSLCKFSRKNRVVFCAFRSGGNGWTPSHIVVGGNGDSRIRIGAAFCLGAVFDERQILATVTKAELTRMLAHNLGCTEVLAQKAVDAFFEIMREAILRGNRIEIRDFGSWTVKTANARPQARNPRTGEVVFVPARKKVRFKPGRAIKEALCQSGVLSGVE